MGRATWILGLLVVASACSSGHSSGDGGATDAVYDLGLDLPGCPAPAGNELGVGKPCTNGGGQCQDPLMCTCDPYLGALLAGVPCFCTLAHPAKNGSKGPCTDTVPLDYCGTNATCCDVLTSAAYCVPNICLPGGMCLQFTAGP